MYILRKNGEWEDDDTSLKRLIENNRQSIIDWENIGKSVQIEKVDRNNKVLKTYRCDMRIKIVPYETNL